MANPDRIVVLEGNDGWYWRRQDRNARNVAHGGEPFSSRLAAIYAAHSLWPMETLPVYRAYGEDRSQSYAFDCMVGPDDQPEPVVDPEAEDGPLVSAPLVPPLQDVQEAGERGTDALLAVKRAAEEAGRA